LGESKPQRAAAIPPPPESRALLPAPLSNVVMVKEVDDHELTAANLATPLEIPVVVEVHATQNIFNCDHLQRENPRRVSLGRIRGLLVDLSIKVAQVENS
jgi:hypothetical protein